MSDAKWTPGPWAYEHSDYPGLEDTVAGEMGRIMQADHGEYTICQMCDFSEPELSANANLIAAAPRMYAALERVANLNPDAGEIGAGMLRSIVGEAQTATAKARGDQ